MSRRDVAYKSAREYAFHEDMTFPAIAINPPGALSDPDFDADNYGYLFDPDKTELLFVGAQMLHSWVEGTPLNPHIHWAKTTNDPGSVLWRLEYKWAPVGHIIDENFTSIDRTTTIATASDTNEANKHIITSFGEIDATDREISDILLMKISRIGADVLDTYGADARLLAFDIHFMANSFGSVERGRK